MRGQREGAVDGLLALGEHARLRLEYALGVWWRRPAPFGDGQRRGEGGREGGEGGRGGRFCGTRNAA